MNTEGTGQESDAPDIVIEEKGTKKKNERERKKGEKKIDQFMKSISNLTSDEKIDALCKRNTDCYESIRTYKGSIQLLQRRIQVLEREKVQLQNDQSKSVLAKSRLETLCRELQRQNKSIKDESVQKIREEEEKRKEMSNRFQTALNEVTQMMQQNTDKNLKLRDDNVEISNKFQTLCEQFKQREEEVTRLSKQMDLEKQLAEATVKRIECELITEKEIWAKEKVYLLQQLKFSEEERLKQKVNIRNLEEHLAMYSTRYEEFETTITKSNKVFDSYKVEMSRLTKQVNKLESDCHSWQERWMQTQQQLKRSLGDKNTLEATLLDRDKKLDKLSSLCRFIQEERTTYLKQLKENGIVPIVTVAPPVPVPPPVPSTSVVPEPKSHHKMSKKEKELSKLKKQVNALETQLVGAVIQDIKQHDNVLHSNAIASHQQDSSSLDATISVQPIVESKAESSVIIPEVVDTSVESNSITPEIPKYTTEMSGQPTIESMSEPNTIIPEQPKTTTNSTDEPIIELTSEPNSIIPEIPKSIETKSEVNIIESNTSEISIDNANSIQAAAALICVLNAMALGLPINNGNDSEVIQSNIISSELTNSKLNTSKESNIDGRDSEEKNTSNVTNSTTTNLETTPNIQKINDSTNNADQGITVHADSSSAKLTNPEGKDELKSKPKGKNVRKKNKK